MLQHGLEVGLLAHFLEEGEPDFRIVHCHVARPEHGPALAFTMGGAQACGEETERTARPLKVGDRGPAISHEVDERRMEGISGTRFMGVPLTSSE